MPDTIDPTGGDSNQATPEAVARWIQQAQAKLHATGRLAPNEIPTGYKVENGQLVQDTRLWSSIYKGLLGTAGMATLGMLLGPTLGATAPTLEATMNAAVPSAATASAVPAASGAANIAAGASTTSTASQLPDWLKVAGELNGPLTALATGQAAGRNADNLANIGYANAQSNLYGNEITGYNDALAAPGKIASNAVRGDILSNAKDVSMSAPSDIPMPTISGGLRPSMFSDATRQTGKNLTASAAATPIPTATMPTPPTLAPFESAGTGTDILNDANTVTSLLKPSYDIWKMFNHA